VFRPSRRQTIKKNAVGAAELALRLAQDRKFRKRMLSALKHSSEASRRTGRGPGLTRAIAQLASDRALQRELRSARKDLRGAYRRLETKRRSRRLLRFAVLAGLGSLAALPQLRERVTTAIAKAPKRREEFTDISSRLRLTDSGSDASRAAALEGLTREELYARAQEADIPGRSEMSKQELVEALRVKS